MELSATPQTGPIFRRAAIGAIRRRARPSTLPELSYVLQGVVPGRDQLARYASVCGFTAIDPMPPTFPHIMAFPVALLLMSDDAFPFPIVGLIHVSNEIEVLAEISADSVLTLRVHAEDLRSHPRGHQFDIVARAATAAGEVWRGRSTYLRRQGAGGRAAESLGVAEPLPEATATVWTVPAIIGRQYAEASGDRNPIHTSRLGARLFGFRRPIAHGMWSFARCLAAMSLPAQPYLATAVFKTPILTPATVSWQPDGEGFTLSDKASGRPHVIGSVKQS